jgi:hypothetical protein
MHRIRDTDLRRRVEIETVTRRLEKVPSQKKSAQARKMASRVDFLRNKVHLLLSHNSGLDRVSKKGMQFHHQDDQEDQKDQKDQEDQKEHKDRGGGGGGGGKKKSSPRKHVDRTESLSSLMQLMSIIQQYHPKGGEGGEGGKVLVLQKPTTRLEKEIRGLKSRLRQLLGEEDIVNYLEKEEEKMLDTLKCCLSLEIFEEPVSHQRSGITFQRKNLQLHFGSGGTKCPLTNTPIHCTEFTNNVALQHAVIAFLTHVIPKIALRKRVWGMTKQDKKRNVLMAFAQMGKSDEELVEILQKL